MLLIFGHKAWPQILIAEQVWFYYYHKIYGTFSCVSVNFFVTVVQWTTDVFVHTGSKSLTLFCQGHEHLVTSVH